jgi:hypothetical protein
MGGKKIKNLMLLRTIGSQPTSLPPPIPSLLFLISVGRFASRAIMGYPFAVPKDESLVLSAYKIKPKGFPFGGNAD